MNEINQSAFEDESTIHFGGDGDEIDFLAGFDDDASTLDAPTTEQQSAEPNNEGNGEVDDSTEPNGQDADAPTTEQQNSSPGKLNFKAKVDHSEQDVSLGMDELPTIYQKSVNMDRAVQRANKAQQDLEQYRNGMEEIASMARALGFDGSTPEETLRAAMNGVISSMREQKVSELVNGGTAQEVAEFIVDQQLKPVPNAAQSNESQSADEQVEDEVQNDGANVSDNSDNAPTPEQFNIDLQSLLARRPEILESGKPFPDEVLKAYMQGENLTVAYLDYEIKQSAAEKQELEKQNRIFQQNQESAKRAPVRGVSGSGNIASKEDPWLAGIDDTYW